MKVSIRLLAYSRTFWAVIVFFGLANLASWLRHRLFPQCCDLEMTIGFPFPFHISGGIAGGAEFYALGLLLDIVIAVTIALVLTRIVNRAEKAT